jgi:A/G-specific adenine glycosylase
VQALRDNPKLSRREISLLWDVPSQVEKAILTLLDDGLIEEQRKGIFSLPQ